MEVLPVKPFAKFMDIPPCEKCGQNDPQVQYCAGQHDGPEKGPHLDVCCQVCKFVWQMETADAIRFGLPADHSGVIGNHGDWCCAKHRLDFEIVSDATGAEGSR